MNRLFFRVLFFLSFDSPDVRIASPPLRQVTRVRMSGATASPSLIHEKIHLCCSESRHGTRSPP